MEIDLFGEIMEVYTKNKDIKQLKNWEELVEKTKKWYNTDFRKFEVIGDDISLKSGRPLKSIHSLDDFCFGFGDFVLYYRKFLLFRGSDVKNSQTYLKVKYSDFGSISFGKYYYNKKRDFKGWSFLTDNSIKKVFSELNQLIQERFNQLEQQKKEERLEIKRKQKLLGLIQEKKRLKELENSKKVVLDSLDVDNNGILDIIEGGDFMRLLKKHQPRIKEIDRTYIQRFIQVSNFIKSQSENLQEIFTRINQVQNQEELESLVGLLKNHIHTYEQILFHSLNMIVSLVDEDDLTFYEIYETFDKLNVFDSGWEKQVSKKLSDINLNISDLMYSVDRMNVQIVNGLNQLSYITEESNRNLVGQLGEIDSSIRVNNLLTGISTYQLYKINKNTKSLRS